MPSAREPGSWLKAFGLAPFGFASMLAPVAVAAEEKGQLELPSQSITATASEETADGPITGYVAKRSTTGAKTDTPITEIPQSISVISADRMRDQGALTVQDALRYVSGVRAETFGLDSRGDWSKVRGSSPALFLDGLQQSFGTYTNVRTDPFTLERLEVLKGPASMLYGQSPVGGLINQVSKRPKTEQHTELQLQYGNYNRKQVAVDTTGPLNPQGTLLYRLVAIQRDSDTQVDHVKDNRQVLMPSLTWRPNDDIDWTILANIQRDDSGSTTQFFPHTGTVWNAPYGRIHSNRFASEPGFDEYDSDQTALTSQFSWHLNDTWTLRQNLRWQKSKVSYQSIYSAFAKKPLFKPDNQTLDRVYYVSKPEVKVWVADQNAEARFDTGPLQHTLLLGGDYQHAVINQDSASGPATPLNVYDPVYGTFDPSVIRLTASPEQRVMQQGLYAQDQIKYEQWLLTLGLRKDWAASQAQGSARQKDDKVTGRAGLTYLFDNGIAPYLSYSESFQPQVGLNRRTLEPYVPLKGKQWELGVKYQPVGSNSLYTAAVYDIREQNRRMPDPLDAMNTLQSGETRARGLELEALVAVTPDWDLIGTYSYTDTTVIKGSPAEQGKRLASVPENMASVWSQHRFSIGDISGFSVGAGVRYVGTSWDGADRLKTPSTTLVDAMLGYRYQNWNLTLNATNLEDKTYYTTCLARGDCFIGNRRTLVGTLAYNF
ncbi:iron complex outermembrane recepter protein [Pseudomonas gessardii]|nr:TonB-dependent siderophore receptor [Pseudomonas gessardii]SDR09383.1 iron complex outermembrane recepter protein [Pseudomonas gessardii]